MLLSEAVPGTGYGHIKICPWQHHTRDTCTCCHLACNGRVGYQHSRSWNIGPGLGYYRNCGEVGDNIVGCWTDLASYLGLPSQLFFVAVEFTAGKKAAAMEFTAAKNTARGGQGMRLGRTFMCVCMCILFVLSPSVKSIETLDLLWH